MIFLKFPCAYEHKGPTLSRVVEKLSQLGTHMKFLGSFMSDHRFRVLYSWCNKKLLRIIKHFFCSAKCCCDFKNKSVLVIMPGDIFRITSHFCVTEKLFE